MNAEIRALSEKIWDYHLMKHIKLYPERGFQEIPHDVWSAYERLVHAGYDKYLIPEKEITKC